MKVDTFYYGADGYNYNYSCRVSYHSCYCRNKVVPLYAAATLHRKDVLYKIGIIGG